MYSVLLCARTLLNLDFSKEGNIACHYIAYRDKYFF